MIVGYSGLPVELTSQCGDVYRNDTRPGLPPTDSVLGMCIRWRNLAEQVILANGGAITGSGATRTYHVPVADPVVPEPERPDPSGPAGLVGQFRAMGQDATVAANFDWGDPNWDPANLRGIADGIIDPRYNGQRAYSTRFVAAHQATAISTRSCFRRCTLSRGLFSRGRDVTNLFLDLTTQPLLGGFFESLALGSARRRGFLRTPCRASRRRAPGLSEHCVQIQPDLRRRPSAARRGSEHFTTIELVRRAHPRPPNASQP